MKTTLENFSDAQRYEQALADQPQHLPQAFREKNARLAVALKPLPQHKYSCHSGIQGFLERVARLSEDYGAPLEMNPDYQRGHVWSRDQQKAFVKAVLRGAVPESGFVVQFNCANWDNHDYQGDLPLGFQCIDGLQRVTALTEFCAGKFDVDGLFVHDLEESSFQISRGRFNFIIQVFSFQSKRELLEHYLAINGGGTPHSEQELERVRNMIESLGHQESRDKQSEALSCPSEGTQKTIHQMEFTHLQTRCREFRAKYCLRNPEPGWCYFVDYHGAWDMSGWTSKEPKAHDYELGTLLVSVSDDKCLVVTDNGPQGYRKQLVEVEIVK